MSKLNYMADNKKIFILGAKGMLGTELCKVFNGQEVFAWDFEELDITNEAQVQEKIIALHPEIIINAAAYNNVDGAEEAREKANLLNGYAPGYIAKAAKDIGAIFIHYSTDYVFNGEKREGYREDDAPHPISSYGESKLLGEEEIRKNTDKFYIIRLSKLFGKIGTGQAVKNSFVDTMLTLAEKRDKLEIIDEELSSPTYAPDLTKRTKYILENNLAFGIYHSANNGACTWFEFAQEIFKQSGKDIEVVPVSGDKFPRPAKRPEYSILLNTKLPEMRKWQIALEEYLNL
ncbi:dTDP-4-dehydrorhamnose reductase [Patescibacteria group bacterium]